MTLKELCDRLALEPRTIRYLISEGVMPAASKLGVAADGYGEEHVERGEWFKRRHEAGMGVRAMAAELSVIFRGIGLELRVADVDEFERASDGDVENALRDVRDAVVKRRISN